MPELQYFETMLRLINVIVDRDIRKIKSRLNKYKLTILWKRFMEDETLSIYI